MRLKWYETAARYLLGAIYLFGAIDGAMFLLFGMYIHGRPADRLVFLLTLQATTYFWAFLKIIQALGAFSLLANYKPALGNALLLPVSSVLCLFYFFEVPALIPPFGLPIIVTTIILTRAYAPSYRRLFDDYPVRMRVSTATESGAPRSAPQR
jgi:hypothetical protein